MRSTWPTGSCLSHDSSQSSPAEDDRLRVAEGLESWCLGRPGRTALYKPEDRPGSVVSWWYRLPRSAGTVLP